MSTSSSFDAFTAPAWTLFQNSCVVPFGMTAILMRPPLPAPPSPPAVCLPGHPTSPIARTDRRRRRRAFIARDPTSGASGNGLFGAEGRGRLGRDHRSRADPVDVHVASEGPVADHDGEIAVGARRVVDRSVVVLERAVARPRAIDAV